MPVQKGSHRNFAYLRRLNSKHKLNQIIITFWAKAVCQIHKGPLKCEAPRSYPIGLKRINLKLRTVKASLKVLTFRYLIFSSKTRCKWTNETLFLPFKKIRTAKKFYKMLRFKTNNLNSKILIARSKHSIKKNLSNPWLETPNPWIRKRLAEDQLRKQHIKIVRKKVKSYTEPCRAISL